MEAVIFCGIQASGKTTFYKETFLKTHVHISLDLFSTRNREQKFLETCLQTGQRFVVDNTNPTKADRAKYIALAKVCNFRVIGYYFSSKLKDSFARNKLRTGKEIIPDVGIKNTYGKLEIPSYAEGFDRLYFVKIEDNKFIIKEWQHEI
jgi:predicted kinase